MNCRAPIHKVVPVEAVYLNGEIPLGLVIDTFRFDEIVQKPVMQSRVAVCNKESEIILKIPYIERFASNLAASGQQRRRLECYCNSYFIVFDEAHVVDAVAELGW